MAPKRKQSGTPRQPSPNMGFLEFTAGRPTARTPARPVPSQPAPPTALITTDLLDLDQIAGSSCVPVRPRQVRGPEVVAQGPALRPVQSVPDDWRLAAELLVDSPESLKWCNHVPLSVRTEALRGHSGEAGGGDGNKQAELTMRLQQALISWRHPSTRLPPAFGKEYGELGLGKPELEYFRALRDQWDAALRALYLGVREGRNSYFYCRNEAFTLLFRNTAAEAALDTADGGGGSGSCGDVWRYLEAGTNCFAVISPTTRKLRTELRSWSVPFDMPRVMRSGHDAGTVSGVFVSPSKDFSKDLQIANGGGGEVADSPAERTRNEDRRLSVERTLGEMQIDGTQHSALCFGTDALPALVDFLINHKAAYFLTLQLISPVPFLHGTPHTPSVRYLPVHHRHGASAKATECIRIDGSERAGGPLLPGALRRMLPLLRDSQAGDFELSVHPDGRNATKSLNLEPPPARSLPLQPLARLPIAMEQGSHAVPLCDIAPRQATRPCQAVERVVCKDGNFHLVA